MRQKSVILGHAVAVSALCAVLLIFAGSSGSAIEQDLAAVGQLLDPNCDPNFSEACPRVRSREGRRLFDVETFEGNGRRCRTCHSKQTGTFSPEDALLRLALDPDDPLFRHDSLDDGVSGTSRITEHATVRIEIELPFYVRLADDPGRRTVILNRGTPTTLNTPALDRLLMYDTRHSDLESQALGAIHAHTQNGREPTALELDLIREFQQTDSRFFSSEALREFANGGSPPQLPLGTTESERRGRLMFDNVPFDGVTPRGLCNACHSGPMLNQFAPGNPFGGPPGGRRADILVSQRNLIGNPVYYFVVTNQNGDEVTLDPTPDPGVLLTLPLPLPPPPIPSPPRSFFANLFKIPSLWGIGNTAPYFHDNSAKTLEEVASHYRFYFERVLRFDFTSQDQADMVAFLKRLR